MTRPTCAHIDLAALSHNLQIVKQLAPTQRVMAMVKADAYGHGVVEVARALSQADALAVAFIDEALQLRGAGVVQPITVLEGAFNSQEIDLACQHGLDLVVHSEAQVAALEMARCSEPLNIWLKVDTGMHRLGLSPQEVKPCYERLHSHPNVGTIRLMSHFSSGDEVSNPVTKQQERLFDQLSQDLDAEKSLANSSAIVAWPSTLRDWIRPGIMLYGAQPFADWRDRNLGIKPVMTLSSSVMSVRELAVGEAVGYGGTWIAERPSRIGVVAIGYGDGYPRCLPSGTPVLVNGQRVPLVGRVSMDMITIDLTDQPQVKEGDDVVLWGQGLPVEEIAEYANTIPYELVTALTSRVPRLYK